MKTETPTEYICSDCGISHADQRTRFPDGSFVKAIDVIPQPKGMGDLPIPIGTIGTVNGHCDDGRVSVVFTGHRGGHTFHHPEGYIEATKKPKEQKPKPVVVESDTPRTDKVYFAQYSSPIAEAEAMRKHAEELERELNKKSTP